MGFEDMMRAKMATAPLQERAEADYAEARRRSAEFVTGSIGKEDVGEALTFERENSLTFNSFEEMKAALLSVIKEPTAAAIAQVDRLVNHERAHAEEARRQGFEVQIGLQIQRTSDGGYHFAPFIKVLFNVADYSEAELPELRRKMKLIAAAPGNVAGSDAEKLG